jgi:hypothetical protein
MGSATPGRVRVERGIYRQPNGKYAVCCRHAGRLHFRTVGSNLAEARRERLALIAETREGSVPVSPRLRFETVAGWWLERFDDLFRPFAAGVGHSGACFLALEDDAQARVRAEARRRLNVEDGPFTLTARAWWARGIAPEA